MLARTSPAQARSVQFTEVGSRAASGGETAKARFSPNAQAILLTKVMALSLAQGVQRGVWVRPVRRRRYSAGEAPFGLIALDGRPRPAFTAYANLISALGTRPAFAGLVRLDPDLCARLRLQQSARAGCVRGGGGFMGFVTVVFL